MTRFTDESVDIKVQWKLFCEKLRFNLSQMEEEARKKITSSRNLGQPFKERKKLLKKLEWCKKARAKLLIKRPFVLDDRDYEIINEGGFEHWFRNYDDWIMNNHDLTKT